MKKLLAASLLLGLLAGATAPAALAQTTPTKTKIKKDKLKTKADNGEKSDASRGGRGPGNRLAELTKDLNLTPEQQTKVAAIQQEQLQQMQAQRGTEDRTARMQQMRAQQQSIDARLKGVLTPEQFQQYQAKKQQQRQRMGPPPGGNR